AIELGASYGINYKKDNVAEKVMEMTNGKGVDAVIDSSGKDSIESSIQSLSEKGRLLIFGSSTGSFNKEILNTVNSLETGMVSQADLKNALSFYAEHEIHPVLSPKIYSLEEYKEAYEELEKGQQFGKIVIKIS
ncbi:MAG: zinc-binding dehydrogenase, partial [Bacillota bacterium]|nr:zinc-binding dehydrogenase [Bacillota bacterium]